MVTTINEESYRSYINNIIKEFNDKTVNIPYSNVLFEKNETHRTFLSYIWNKTKSPCVVFMLNPSSATSDKDDKTTKILKERLKNNGYGGVHILNLYTHICGNSNNNEIKKDKLDNYDTVLNNILDSFQSINLDIIYAWGCKGKEPKTFKNKVLNPLCFGTLTNGHPRHPNPRPINDYPIDTQLISYRQN